MNWSLLVSLAWTLGLAVVIVALIWLAAMLRVRGVTVAIVGVLLGGGAVAVRKAGPRSSLPGFRFRDLLENGM